MKKEMTKAGICKTCGINCWKETNGEPSIWPCGIPKCPYPRGEVIVFPQSQTGSSMAQIT